MRRAIIARAWCRRLRLHLRRLKTDYIDLYWLHIWDQMTPAEEVMRAFDDLVRHGKVMYIGISDAPAWWIAQANTLAQLRGWTQFIGLQIEYSLIERTVERELIPMAKAFNLGLVAWSPLAGGLLSGKYHSGNGSGWPATQPIWPRPSCRTGERPDRIVAALEEISQADGTLTRSGCAGMASLSRYSSHSDCRRAERGAIEDNLASLELAADARTGCRSDQASAIELGFPHDFYRK